MDKTHKVTQRVPKSQRLPSSPPLACPLSFNDQFLFAKYPPSDSPLLFSGVVAKLPGLGLLGFFPLPAGLLACPFIPPLLKLYRFQPRFCCGFGVFNLMSSSLSEMLGLWLVEEEGARSILASASRRVSPDVSSAIRNRASSLHSSHSEASLARCKRRMHCRELDSRSSKVWSTSR